MKKFVLIMVLAGLGAVGYYWWNSMGAAEGEKKEKDQTEAVKKDTIRQEVQCPGRVVSNRDIEIKCRASGEIVKIPFDVSDVVKKGDMLLELDPKDQIRTLNQSKASLAASEARLAQAKSNLATAEKNVEVLKMKASAGLDSAAARKADAKAKASRQEELLQKKFSSPEQYETARTSAVQAENELQNAQASVEDVKTQELALEARRQDVALAAAQLESSKIALDLAELQLDYTKVFSPIDGVIAARNVQAGQIISSGVTNVGGGTTTFILSDLSHVYVYASVDESNIGKVQVGQKATITADAYPKMRFDGQVNRIGTKGVNLQNVVTFEVRIEVNDENKLLLKPEMTANVTILTAEKADILTIPSASIIRNKQKTYVTLAKKDGTTEEEHPIETGITDGMMTEVVSGLNEGDEIVVYRPEDESRWRAGANGMSQARKDHVQQHVMERTLGVDRRGGGGGGGGGGRRGG